MLFTWNDFCAIVTLGVGEIRSNAPRHMAIPTSFIVLFLSSADDSTRRLDPGLLEQASMSQMRAVAPGLLLSQGKVSNALPAAEHLAEPKFPSTRDMSCPRGCPVGSGKHAVRGE